MNEVIVITDGYTLNPGDLSWDGIARLGTIQYFDHTPGKEVPDRCRNASVIVTNKTPVTAETIGSAKNLRLISVTATGYNIVDIAAAKKRGITVCNVPGYGTDSVAQHTFALLLELTNHVGANARSVREGEWSRSRDFCYSKGPLMELAGKTMGIVGYGDIGQKVGELARAFGMQVVYSRSPASKDPNSIPLEELFAVSDVVSLHCPLTAENKEFVSLSILRRMKPTAFLINTARGQLIREEDLATALKDRLIAGAAVDVLSTEPPSPQNPLLQAPSCIITPHNAWLSFEARDRIMKVTTKNIAAFLTGTPENLIV